MNEEQVKEKIADINRIIFTIESFVFTLVMKRKEVKKMLMTRPDHEASLELLEEIEEELTRYRKLRRRAKCRLYDFRYYNTDKGMQNRKKRALEQRRAIWAIEIKNG